MAWWEPTTGSYTAVAAYRAIGAASLAASYVNLANPGTNDATAPGTAPTFDAADGWTFTGTTPRRYLATGLSPAAGWTMLVRFSNISGATGALLGLYKYTATTGGWAIFPNVSSKVFYYGAGELQVAPNDAAGVLGIAGADAYRDGVDEGNIPAGTFPAFNNLYIGIIYDGTTYRNATELSGKIQAVAIYSTTLDATQMAEISANMAALTSAVMYEQAVAGTLTSAGTLVKRTNKTLAGTLTSAGAVVKRTARALAGTLTSAGALTKRTGKVLAGVLTSSGTLAAVYSAAAQGLIDLTARARSFALEARERVFALTARSRE